MCFQFLCVFFPSFQFSAAAMHPVYAHSNSRLAISAAFCASVLFHFRLTSKRESDSKVWDKEWEPKFVLSVNDFSEGTSCKTYPCMDRFVSFFSVLFKNIRKHTNVYCWLYDKTELTRKAEKKNPRQTRIKSERTHFKESDSVHWCLSLSETVLLLIYLINL